MGLTDRLKEMIARKRHKRGFGIHSPFAFHLITEVIAQGPYAYYCYDRLDELARAEGRDPRRVRLLMRLAAELGGSRIGMTGPRSEALTAAFRGYDTRRVIVSNDEAINYLGYCARRGEAPFVYIHDPAALEPHLLDATCEALRLGGTVVVAAVGSSAARETLEALGMTFAGRDLSVIVGRRGLPHQRFVTEL